jgi:hypothetical protein
MYKSIVPVQFRVTCGAWECSPESDRLSPPLTKPLVVDASSAADVGRIARQHGWRPGPSRGSWWCPRHAKIGGVA